MPLSRTLYHVPMTHPCPHCGHKLEKNGSYFQAVVHYRCGSCRHEVGVPYEAKVKLFDDHAHLGTARISN
jgi:transposase-like protein